MSQPFLRFYEIPKWIRIRELTGVVVSTLLEILALQEARHTAGSAGRRVSTLLEILGGRNKRAETACRRSIWFQPFLRFWRPLTIERKIVFSRLFQPFLRFWDDIDCLIEYVAKKYVSTLLEILGLMWLVFVGF